MNRRKSLFEQTGVGGGKVPDTYLKEANMKIFKRVLAVAVLVLAALIISYLVYTGGQLHA